jgi:hypothetical protein
MCPALCPSPTPVANLPSTAQAGQQALAILAKAGIDVRAADVSATAEPWADLVSVSPTVGGLPTLGTTYSFAIGAKGVVQFAGGVLATPTELATYPLVGAAAGFARLQAGHDLVWGAPAVRLAPPSPSAQQVTVTGASVVLVRVSGTAGSYLEPAYLFHLAGSSYTPAVAAVGDGDLQPVQPGGPIQGLKGAASAPPPTGVGG